MSSTQNFERVAEEIRRQFNILKKVDDSHDTKIGIFLGFIVLATVQIVAFENLTSAFFATNLSIALFIAGSILLIFSGYAGMRAYFFRKYKLGPNIDDLINVLRKEPKVNISEKIARTLYDDNIWNTRQIERKVYYMKMMFISFLLGFLLVFVSRVTSIIGLEVFINVV